MNKMKNLCLTIMFIVSMLAVSGIAAATVDINFVKVNGDEFEPGDIDTIQVEKNDVDAQLSRFKQQFPTEEAFRKSLSERSLTVAILESQIEKGFAIQKFVQERFVNQIKIGKTEPQEFYDANPSLFLQPEMVRAIVEQPLAPARQTP